MILIDGSEIALNTIEPFVENHFLDTRNYTFEILEQINKGFYKNFIDENDKIIFDLGANIGLFSLHVTPYAKTIIALEPTPSHFKILSKLTENSLDIWAINGAIGDTDGEVDFYISYSNTTRNSLVNRNFLDTIKVKSYTLKSLMEFTDCETIDFLKIDIEGSEVVFLTDETIDLIGKVVKKFFIEFHEVNGLSYTEHRNNYRQKFEKLGFTCEDISLDALFCYKS